MRMDMVGDISYKETYYLWTWTTLPIWIVWFWILFVAFRSHRNCRTIHSLPGHTIYVDPHEPSKFTIHNGESNLIKQLEQSAGTVLLETLVTRYQVSPDAIRLNFTRSSDLVMFRLTTDLQLEVDHDF